MEAYKIIFMAAVATALWPTTMVTSDQSSSQKIGDRSLIIGGEPARKEDNYGFFGKFLDIVFRRHHRSTIPISQSFLVSFSY